MKGSGSVLGPGAVSGANVILGRLKAAKTSSVTLADLVSDFQWSCTAFRKYRSLVRKELSRLRRVRVCTKTAIARKKDLIAAGEAMLRERDTGLEFCLCELSKIVAFTKTASGKHQAYQRQRARQGKPSCKKRSRKIRVRQKKETEVPQTGCRYCLLTLVDRHPFSWFGDQLP